MPDIDYNAFIKWAQEDPHFRYVEIKTDHSNANVVSVFVNNYANESGGFVKTLEEIEELKEKKKQRELAEYERLKAKFEPAIIDGYDANGDPVVAGYDADGNPVDDGDCRFYRENVAN